MKYLLIILTTALSFQSFAETYDKEVEELAQILESQRAPSNDVQMESLGVKKMDKIELNQYDQVEEINGKAVESPRKAMKLYNESLKSTNAVKVQRSKDDSSTKQE